MLDNMSEKREPSFLKKQALADQQKAKGDEDEYMKVIIVLAENEHEIHFRIKSTSQLGQLKKAYIDRLGVPLTDLGFFFDGRPVKDEDTPKKLGMKTNDIIQIVSEQPHFHSA